MVLIRLAKIAMIATLAAYAFIVAYDNIVDYQSNYEFVRHVLSMDTTFPGNALMHRAITNENVWRIAYALIIAMEGLTALLLAFGALVLLGRLGAPAEVFNRSKVGSGRIDCRLWPLVFRVHGNRRRILRHVAVQGLERTRRGVPHRHSDPWSAYFRQLAGRRP
jgi:predicted small integral membrane protein